MKNHAISLEVAAARTWCAAAIVRADALVQSTRDLARNVDTARYDASRENTRNHLRYMQHILSDGRDVMASAMLSLSVEAEP